MWTVLSMDAAISVVGTVRSSDSIQLLSNTLSGKIQANIDAHDSNKLKNLFDSLRPDVVINCIGITKHVSGSDQPLKAIELNALFPHRIAELCEDFRSRLIQISTDCVFSGQRGNYSELDTPDAVDIYGRSKALGEVLYGNSLTIRTSTIGHELNTSYGLLDWFLSQNGKSCKGFKRAIFSGLPTVILAQIVGKIIVDYPKLLGLYHIAAEPINKYDLLCLISKIYKNKIRIDEDDSLIIDRSLDQSKFYEATGIKSPDWPSMIESMYQFKREHYE
jgi:dTDP-4-dehydrorhamnose reductase